MDKVRIAVIGAGWWGTVGHLRPLAQIAEADLVAVYSRTEAKARKRAEELGIPRFYDNYQRMIQECDLDAVTIATTPNVHYEQAKYAIEHGLHVLMEKPFVLQAAHAVELAEIADAGELLLSVCHPLLHYELLTNARRYILDGALGDILLVNALFSQRVYDLYKGDVDAVWEKRLRGDDAKPNRTSYSDPAVSGGGEGHTQASHILGMLLWLTGLSPISVYACMNSLDVAVDVVDAMTITFEGGALGNVSANGMLPEGVAWSGIQIQGTKGILVLDTASRGAFVRLEGDAEMRRIEGQMPRRSVASEVPRNFVRAILGLDEQWVATRVAIDEVRILDAAYRSASSGQAVTL